MTIQYLKLMDAILEAYDLYHTAKDVTGDGNDETFCNFAVNHVLEAMGYDKFSNNGKPLLANQMIEAMDALDEWVPIQMKDTQIVNNGFVVVAGMYGYEHGHVVIVRPGIPVWSEKYKSFVPKVSHVGMNSFIGRGVNYAFWGTTPPKFWMLSPNFNGVVMP